MDLTEAEDIKKRWQEYTEELYQKDLHNQDNHVSVISNLEPDSLECEVKWALESITTKKACGSDVTPVEVFQILKHDAVKVLHSICQQIWKPQQDFPGGSEVKVCASNAGDLGLISGLGRSPGEGKAYPLQYSSILAWRIPWTV